MSVSVKIPTQLREATGGEALASVDGATVGEVLDSLYERYGELRNRIAEDGGLRRFVNVYVGEEDIRFLDYLDTAVSDGDVVTILPAVAGGAGSGVCRRNARRGLVGEGVVVGTRALRRQTPEPLAWHASVSPAGIRPGEGRDGAGRRGTASWAGVPTTPKVPSYGVAAVRLSASPVRHVPIRTGKSTWKIASLP